MTEEQFKELMKQLDFIALQLTKIIVGIAATMTPGEAKSFEKGMTDITNGWNKQ